MNGYRETWFMKYIFKIHKMNIQTKCIVFVYCDILKYS
jgi:hypothetical protein